MDGRLLQQHRPRARRDRVAKPQPAERALLMGTRGRCDGRERERERERERGAERGGKFEGKIVPRGQADRKVLPI